MQKPWSSLSQNHSEYKKNLILFFIYKKGVFFLFLLGQVRSFFCVWTEQEYSKKVCNKSCFVDLTYKYTSICSKPVVLTFQIESTEWTEQTILLLLTITLKWSLLYILLAKCMLLRSLLAVITELFFDWVNNKLFVNCMLDWLIDLVKLFAV